MKPLSWGKLIDIWTKTNTKRKTNYSGKYADDSMYHSHGHSLLLFLKAYLSLEMPEIEAAQVSSTQTLALCDTIRPQNYRDNFIVKLFVKPNYEEFSDGKIVETTILKITTNHKLIFLRGNTCRAYSYWADRFWQYAWVFCWTEPLWSCEDFSSVTYLLSHLQVSLFLLYSCLL